MKPFRHARTELIEGLNQCDFITAFPSAANYVLCELHGYTSREIIGCAAYLHEKEL